MITTSGRLPAIPISPAYASIKITSMKYASNYKFLLVLPETGTYSSGTTNQRREIAMKTTYLVFSGEYLVQAQRHCSKASAIEAFRDVAVELDCYDQRIEAALYYAEKRSEIAEYPDFLLSLGPRGGVKIERATTAAANSIMLSVLNDGTIYKDRMHCGFAMLQGSSHRMPFRDLANNEAIKQRREFGSKFRAAEISEAEIGRAHV